MTQRMVWVSLLALGAVAAPGGVPFVPPSRVHLRCESPVGDTAPLDLRQLRDRWHLRNDVETAEEIGVRHGDSRRKTEGRLGEHRRQRECTDTLLTDIATRHRVSLDDVAAMRGRRPVVLDATVLACFTTAFLMFSRRFIAGIGERFADAPSLRFTASIVISLFGGVVAAGGLILSARLVETVRLWDGHTSYRGGRLPWEQHPALVFAAAVATLCILAFTGTHAPRRNRSMRG